MARFRKTTYQSWFNRNLTNFGDNLYLLPEGLPDLGKLKIARNGLHLGIFKKNRFEPSFALGLALSPDDVEQFVKIDIEQFRVYVSGNIVKLEEPIQNGWYLVVINGNGMGFAKNYWKYSEKSLP